MKALVLGAGFSKWAADLPVVSQLFDMNVSTRTEREARRLTTIERDFHKWRAANLGANPELFVQWSLLQSPRRANRVIWYVARRLSDPFLAPILGGTSALMIDEKRTGLHEGVRKARAFLSSVTSHDCCGIVSVNYDLLVEYALGSNGFHYGVHGEILNGRGINPLFPWQNSGASLDGDIPLAKIHGSLSWTVDEKWSSGRPGLNGRALIVAPAPEKTPPKRLAATWSLAKDILHRASEIVVFGFAFNPYDKAVLDLLKTASPQQVSLVDILDYRQAASSIWPRATLKWWPSADEFQAGNVRERMNG